ncbi:MAG: hypothetical protein DWP97_02665 [Calditrichaeota bacterium]|nr:MAG: hypothetical protein DWP97_02665 [Calditrichota bacterium]
MTASWIFVWNTLRQAQGDLYYVLSGVPPDSNVGFFARFGSLSEPDLRVLYKLAEPLKGSALLTVLSEPRGFRPTSFTLKGSALQILS